MHGPEGLILDVQLHGSSIGTLTRTNDGNTRFRFDTRYADSPVRDTVRPHQDLFLLWLLGEDLPGAVRALGGPPGAKSPGRRWICSTRSGGKSRPIC